MFHFDYRKRYFGASSDGDETAHATFFPPSNTPPLPPPPSSTPDPASSARTRSVTSSGNSLSELLSSGSFPYSLLVHSRPRIGPLLSSCPPSPPAPPEVSFLATPTLREEVGDDYGSMEVDAPISTPPSTSSTRQSESSSLSRSSSQPRGILHRPLPLSKPPSPSSCDVQVHALPNTSCPSPSLSKFVNVKQPSPPPSSSPRYDEAPTILGLGPRTRSIILSHYASQPNPTTEQLDVLSDRFIASRSTSNCVDTDHKDDSSFTSKDSNISRLDEEPSLDRAGLAQWFAARRQRDETRMDSIYGQGKEENRSNLKAKISRRKRKREVLTEDHNDDDRPGSKTRLRSRSGVEAHAEAASVDESKVGPGIALALDATDSRRASVRVLARTTAPGVQSSLLHDTGSNWSSSFLGSEDGEKDDESVNDSSFLSSISARESNDATSALASNSSLDLSSPATSSSPMSHSLSPSLPFMAQSHTMVSMMESLDDVRHPFGQWTSVKKLHIITGLFQSSPHLLSQASQGSQTYDASQPLRTQPKWKRVESVSYALLSELRPSREQRETIAEQVGLELSQVSKFISRTRGEIRDRCISAIMRDIISDAWATVTGEHHEDSSAKAEQDDLMEVYEEESAQKPLGGDVAEERREEGNTSESYRLRSKADSPTRGDAGDGMMDLVTESHLQHIPSESDTGVGPSRSAYHNKTEDKEVPSEEGKIEDEKDDAPEAAAWALLSLAKSARTTSHIPSAKTLERGRQGSGSSTTTAVETPSTSNSYSTAVSSRSSSWGSTCEPGTLKTRSVAPNASPTTENSHSSSHSQLYPNPRRPTLAQPHITASSQLDEDKKIPDDLSSHIRQKRTSSHSVQPGVPVYGPALPRISLPGENCTSSHKQSPWMQPLPPLATLNLQSRVFDQGPITNTPTGPEYVSSAHIIANYAYPAGNKAHVSSVPYEPSAAPSRPPNLSIQTSNVVPVMFPPGSSGSDGSPTTTLFGEMTPRTACPMEYMDHPLPSPVSRTPGTIYHPIPKPIPMLIPFTHDDDDEQPDNGIGAAESVGNSWPTAFSMYRRGSMESYHHLPVDSVEGGRSLIVNHELMTHPTNTSAIPVAMDKIGLAARGFPPNALHTTGPPTTKVPSKLSLARSRSEYPPHDANPPL